MKKRSFWKRLFWCCVLCGMLGAVLPQMAILHTTKNRILELEHLPESRVAIVFGASVIRNSIPSHTLEDRIVSAVELYHVGKVQKLLMTGDNSEKDYNEVEVMKKTAQNLGVPGEDIVLDYAGFRTYDSCARAEKIFGVSDAILVTQAFHLPRAVYLCREFGVNAFGFAADRRTYASQEFNQFREFFARISAFFEIHFFRHDPKFLGEKVEIFASEPSDDEGE